MRSSISALLVRSGANESTCEESIDLHGEVLEPKESLTIVISDKDAVHTPYSGLHTGLSASPLSRRTILG